MWLMISTMATRQSCEGGVVNLHRCHDQHDGYHYLAMRGVAALHMFSCKALTRSDHEEKRKPTAEAYK